MKSYTMLRLTLVLFVCLCGLWLWQEHSGVKAATLTVSNTNNSGAGSLRQAIADAVSGDTINFNLSGCPCTITLTSGELVINKDLTINGPGTSLLTISGNNVSRVFFINPGAPGATTGPPATNPVVHLSNLTIANGRARGGNGGRGGGGAAGMGGGMFINGGNVTLTQVAFTGNQAIGGNGGGFGGNGGGGGIGGNGGDGSEANGGSGGSLGGFGGIEGDEIPESHAATAGGEGGGGGGGDFGLPGGAGGYGGGGGGSSCCAGGDGAKGGFGGGGGGAINGNGGTSSGLGGRGGSGVQGADGAGGGGAGLGGAIFMRTGSLALGGSSFTSNSATPGNTTSANNATPGIRGRAKGGAIFIHAGNVISCPLPSFSNNTATDAQTVDTDNANVFGTLKAATTAAFQLAFFQQPTRTPTGSVISPAVTVRVLDACGTLVSSSTATITLALANNFTGATLGGTTSVSAVGGVATFNNLSVSRAGTGYRLGATSGTLKGALSLTFDIPTNTAPTFTPAAAISRQLGSVAGVAVTVGTVTDSQTAPSSLTVTQIAGGTATGITVSGITNTNGTIHALFSASCTATSGTVRFQVSDGSLTGTGNLQVNVTANTAPTLTYTNRFASSGGAFSISPATGPSDNGTLSSIVVQSQGTYTGTISVNSAGVVSISNAKPSGAHTITIRATDNCGTQTNATFTLTVNCPTITLAPAALPNGTTGTSYNATINAGGAAPPYTFTTSAGALPNGLTLSSAGVLSGTPSVANTFNFTVKATDASGCTGTLAYTVTISAANNPPTVTAAAVSRQQGSPAGNATIANVNDSDQALNTLAVTVNGATSANVNGVSISNLTVNAAGQVSANVAAGCLATDASFTLTVRDTAGASANATLLVTVTPDAAPTLGTYPPTLVAPGGNATVTPSAPPADNGGIADVTVLVSQGFTGAVSVNKTTGAVTITNAGPLGTYQVNLTITDNCGKTTTAAFNLTVNDCGATLSQSNQNFTAGGGAGSFTVTINSACAWSAVSNNLDFITVTSPAGATAGNGTVNFTVASNTNPTPRSGSMAVGGQTFTVQQAAHATHAPDTAGIFRGGFFWLQDVDGDKKYEEPPDRSFAFGGVEGDIPIAGDWNGDGKSKVGVYRPANGLFILDYDGDRQFTEADRVYDLGLGSVAGDVPVVGDWDGSGKDKVGLFRSGFYWILDANGNGAFDAGTDLTHSFGGVEGDVPVVGDWDGSGKDKVGLFRSGFFWILDVNGDGVVNNVNEAGGDQTFAFGGVEGDVPVVGDWNGDGRDKVGVFRDSFFWVLDANGNRQFDGIEAGQDLAYAFGGMLGDKPIVGKW